MRTSAGSTVPSVQSAFPKRGDVHHVGGVGRENEKNVEEGRGITNLALQEQTTTFNGQACLVAGPSLPLAHGLEFLLKFLGLF